MGDLQPVLRQWMVLRMLSARRYGATVREMAEETGASQKSIRRDPQAFAVPDRVAPEHDEIRHYKLDRISDVEVDPQRPPGKCEAN